MQNKLFADKEFRPVLRLYIPHWNEEHIRNEAIAYCREAGIRDILLFSDAQYLVWNQLSPEEIERELAVWKRSVEIFKAAGIKTVGLNCSLMQMQSSADHRQHMDYDYYLTNADGTSLNNLPCPLDPKLDRFTDLFFKKAASSKADYIFMDDDLRYMNTANANGLGCFCDLHIRKFNEEYGFSLDRRELQQAILDDPELRLKWLAFNGSALERVASNIQRAAKSGNPDVRVGLMVPCTNGIALNGNDLETTVKNICGKDVFLLRPCIGPYQDHCRKQITAGLFHLEITRKIFGDSSEYTPEIETSPSTVISKSAAVARYYIIQGLLNRMNAPLFTTVGYCGDTPYMEPRYLDMFKNSGDFFRTVCENAPIPECRKGIGFLSDLNAAQKYDRQLKSVTELYMPALSLHEVCDTAGLPHTYESSPITFIAGLHAAGLSDSALENILSRGAFIDSLAADIICRRGYGRLIGVEKVETIARKSAAEKCTDSEIFGKFCGSYIQSRLAAANTTCRFYPLPEAETVSEFTDHDLQVIYPAVLRFSNSAGGKTVVIPYRISDLCSSVELFTQTCHQRQQMFNALVRWMDPDLIPYSLPTGSEIVTQYWDEPGRIVMTLTNIAYDVYDSYRINTALPLAKASYIDPDGRILPLDFSDGLLRARLEPFRPLIIILKK